VTGAEGQPAGASLGLPPDQPAIVCGIAEGSDSHTAARVAARLAERLGATLVLVHVGLEPFVRLGPSTTYERRRRRKRAFHESGLLRVVLEPVPVEDSTVLRRVVFGPSPSEELRRLAGHEAVKLLVVGSQRPGAFEAVLGSTSAELAQAAPCPVVVVPVGVPADLRCDGCVICGVADEAADANVVLTAAELAQRLGVALVLAHVGEPRDPSFLDALRRVAQETAPQLVIDHHIANGRPAGALARYAAERDATLIAVGTRGRGALLSAVLGSVSAELVRTTDRPMLVVPARS
jgi:nucleotide-binding universal stress UspA family protein